MNILNWFKKIVESEKLEPTSDIVIKKSYKQRFEELKIENINLYNEVVSLEKEYSGKFKIGTKVKTIYENSPSMTITYIVYPFCYVDCDNFWVNHGWVNCKYFDNNKKLTEIRLNIDELVVV